MAQEQAKQLQTVKWLMATLNTSSSTTYDLIAQGRIPGVVRISDRILRIDPDVTLQWIEAGGFVADEVDASRRAQGLEERVTDGATLAQVASHLTRAER